MMVSLLSHQLIILCKAGKQRDEAMALTTVINVLLLRLFSNFVSIALMLWQKNINANKRWFELAILRKFLYFHNFCSKT